MKIFTDKELSNRVDTFDLGVVPAGQSKKFTYWIENDDIAFLTELVFTVLGMEGIRHPEVEIIDQPISMEAHAIGELVLEWTPSITLKEGLKARLDIKGKEHWA